MKRLWIPLSILATVIFLTVLYFGVTQTYNDMTAKALKTQEETVEQPATAQSLLEAVNAERAKVGVAPLVLDEKLMQSAQWTAEDMVSKGRYGHFDADGNNVGLDYLETLKPSCAYISENLVWGYDGEVVLTAGEAVYSWSMSEAHKKAMLNTDYTRTGFGIYGTAAVQHFCKP